MLGDRYPLGNDDRGLTVRVDNRGDVEIVVVKVGLYGGIIAVANHELPSNVLVHLGIC